MNDAGNKQPMSADAHESTGHGKHRGPVSVQNDEATPNGRHRKPSEQAENRA